MTGSAVNILYAGSSEPEELQNLKNFLNCNVYQANNLDTCYVKLTEKKAEILILDLDDDAKEQVALLKKILELKILEHVEVLLLTSASLAPEIRILCLKNGVSHILQKPFNVHEFALLIERSYDRLMTLKALEGQVEELSRNAQVLGKYFSKDIKEHILNNRLQGDEKGIMTYASVLSFDVRSSTDIAGSISPDLFAGFLSSLFEGITALIYANHGSVSKYVGDGVLATFGYPVFYNNDIYNSVKCALEIRNFIRAFNESRPVYLKNKIQFGVGISTGKIFAGNVGSSFRKEHTVVGDPVNLATRLQILTRQAEVDILIDAETHDSLTDSLDVKQVKFHRGKDKVDDSVIYYVLNMKANAPIATALTDAELQSTYNNTAGEVEFF